MTIPGKARQRLIWTTSIRYVKHLHLLSLLRRSCHLVHSFLFLVCLSSQNHLIVTVPPFHNQSVTSPVSVGIFVVTNAGRSHEAQTFTYVPDTGTAVLSKRPPRPNSSHFCAEPIQTAQFVFSTPPSGDNSESQMVKTEEPSLLEPCIFDRQPKSISSEQSDCSGQSSKRQEDTPMEVSSTQTPTDVFKVRYYQFRGKKCLHFKYVPGFTL